MQPGPLPTAPFVTGGWDGTGILLPVYSKEGSSLKHDGSEQRMGSPAVLMEIQHKAPVATGLLLLH